MKPRFGRPLPFSPAPFLPFRLPPSAFRLHPSAFILLPFPCLLSPLDGGQRLSGVAVDHPIVIHNGLFERGNGLLGSDLPKNPTCIGEEPRVVAGAKLSEYG